jgi:hypothetical protein
MGSMSQSTKAMSAGALSELPMSALLMTVSLYVAIAASYLQCAELKADVDSASKRAVIPAKAGRSAQRGEHPKDGPEGVSEANHPFRMLRDTQRTSKCVARFAFEMDSGLRRNDVRQEIDA